MSKDRPVAVVFQDPSVGGAPRVELRADDEALERHGFARNAGQQPGVQRLDFPLIPLYLVFALPMAHQKGPGGAILRGWTTVFVNEPRAPGLVSCVMHQRMPIASVTPRFSAIAALPALDD